MSDPPLRPAPIPLPPPLSLPSALCLRPHLTVSTRLRARSITSGSGSVAPAVTPMPYLSPTLVGSPVLPMTETFLGSRRGEAGRLGGGGREEWRRSGREEEGSGVDDEEEGAFTETEGSSNSTTESDSPPPTPVDPYALPTFRISGEGEHWREDAEGRAGGDEVPKQRRRAEIALEGSTRIGRRRGRSFTSLLMQPVPIPSPAVERDEPILEREEKGSPPPPQPTLAVDTEDLPLPLHYTPTTPSFPPSALIPSDDLVPPKTLRDFVPQVALLAVLFISSFILIFLLIATIPALHIPRTISDIPTLATSLTTYRASSLLAELHLFGVLSALFLWQQCTSIPGSVLTNILFGALYGTAAGTWWACLWTALGSTGAYGLAMVISPLVEHYFQTPLAVTRRALQLPSTSDSPSEAIAQPVSSSDLFSHLLLARFFPLLPYSVLNVISGVLRLPLPIFILTLLLGSFPFNFVTVSLGSVLSLAASSSLSPSSSDGSNKIWSLAMFGKLVAVTLVSVLPLVFKSHLKWLVGNKRLARGVVEAARRIVWAWETLWKNVVEAVGGAVAGTGLGVGSICETVTATRRSSGRGTRGEWRRKWTAAAGRKGRTVAVGRVERSVVGRWEGDGESDEEGAEEGRLVAA